jgi:hypothetical protein
MELPDVSFFLFGMGDRRKLVYKDSVLYDALTRETVREWDTASEDIRPSEYTVVLETKRGNKVVIREDEDGVWLNEQGKQASLTRSELKLPQFNGHKHAKLLRVLHHEILINIINGLPVPNFFVYPKPWVRDAAAMCACLGKTGNLRLVRDWILGLREPFDRNAGNVETDNLGQSLYLVSLVSDASHPLVETVLNAMPEYTKDKHLVGLTDFAEHPVYQTKWLKLGLKRLGLRDDYEIPKVYDSYSALFWMGYKGCHVEGKPLGQREKDLYPYLGWAEAHFHGWPAPKALIGEGYPVTGESHATQADYDGMVKISQQYVDNKICVPHGWHAAEAFLYLLEK